MPKSFFCHNCRRSYKVHYNPHTFIYQCPDCNAPFNDRRNHYIYKKLRKQKAIFLSQIICAIKQAKLRRQCVHVGTNVRVDPGFKCLSGNLIIGNNVKLNNSFIDATASVKIGDFTFFGPDVQILTATHDITQFGIERQGSILSKPISIGKGVFIASRVTIIGGTRIGDNAVIGAGSVVTKDIPECTFAAGSPARVIKRLER